MQGDHTLEDAEADLAQHLCIQPCLIPEDNNNKTVFITILAVTQYLLFLIEWDSSDTVYVTC